MVVVDEASMARSVVPSQRIIPIYNIQLLIHIYQNEYTLFPVTTLCAGIAATPSTFQNE
jgi:hypothetical protein